MWKVLLLLAAVSAAAVKALPRAPALAGSQLRSLSLQASKEATPGQFPHQVGVWVSLDEEGSRQAFCGGAILSEHIVITAAHCAQSGVKFTIVAGAHDIHNDGTNYVTSKKLVQESYSPNVQNDIALLYIEESIEFNERVQPIRLPSAEKAEDSFYNAEVTLSGWGSKNIDDATTLHFSKSHVISNRYCSAVYFTQYIRDSNICASGLWGKAACQVDGGSPLVTYEADGKPTLLGVKSFTTALGCEAVFPVVFTRVGWYLDWIAESSKALSS